MQHAGHWSCQASCEKHTLCHLPLSFYPYCWCVAGERALERTAERAAERAAEHAAEVAMGRGTQRALERAGERAIERAGERAAERAGKQHHGTLCLINEHATGQPWQYYLTLLQCLATRRIWACRMV